MTDPHAPEPKVIKVDQACPICGHVGLVVFELTPYRMDCDECGHVEQLEDRVVIGGKLVEDDDIPF